jgi:catechol 2,3-dioxygenase-like lactoylglutathione lyase family enzyme
MTAPTMDRLIPMLPVRSMPASVEFYGKLGFTVESRNDGWGWAMLRLDECRLMVDQSINQNPGKARDACSIYIPGTSRHTMRCFAATASKSRSST